MIYFINGELSDTKGAGVTVAAYSANEDGTPVVLLTSHGSPFLGYKPKQVTKEEFDLWQKRILAPDMVTYFPSMFAGIGVVDKAAYDYMQAKNAEAMEVKVAAEVSANRVAYKLAKREAEAIEEPIQEVFRSKYPNVSQKAFDILHKML